MRLNSKTAKRLRSKAGYHGGRPGAPAGNRTHPGYKFHGIHHLLEFPLYNMHERTIREMGPRGKIIARTVQKIVYGRDGRTPLSPQWVEGKNEAGEKVMIPKTELVPIPKPATLMPGPKATYRRMKRLWERLESRHV